MSTISPNFVDSSTDCAICLEPLDNQRNLTLSCGHCWHYACLEQQLRTAQPQSTKRILFNGCQCAKCGTVCEHEELRELTRTTDVLRARVDELIRQQLGVNTPQEMEEAYRKYAFYLCSHCQEPYFGGTVACSDQEEEPEERLCAACTPQVVCRRPTEHAVVYKCRYCCQPASFVCYGNVHFCSACHDENSRGNVVTTKPCTQDCIYPNPPGQDHHRNGPSKECEQAYFCALCQHDEEEVVVPGSQNYVVNGSGQEGNSGWMRAQRHKSWQVEMSDVPVREGITTNFVSSFVWCVMVQRIDLEAIVRPNVPHTWQVSARYRGRTDCPSVFRLQVIVQDNHQRALHQESTPILEAPPDYWERASLYVSVQRATYLIILVMGKDSRFWQGNFGSKVADISARVLGSPDVLDAVLLSRSATSGDNEGANDVSSRSAPSERSWLWWDVLVPVALLLLVCLISFY